MKKLFTLIACAFMALGVNAQTKTTLWEGEVAFDESWSGSQTISKASFATAKAGDELIITAEPVEAVEWKYGSQVFLKTLREGWAAIASTVNVDKAGDYTVKITNSDITLEKTEITTTMLSELQEYGLAVQGIDAKVTKVVLVSTVATKDVELTLTEGHTVLATEFDKYADDTKIKLSFANNTDPYESRNGWGIGGFANSDNWTPTYAIKALDGTTFDVYVTVGDFKTAAKNGTDDYVAGEYHAGGVTFNIYNGCKLTGVYVQVESTPTSISAAPAAEASDNAPIYNLKGQKVDKSYKGIKVQNGKKFM